jgi:putative ABC transport system permease protein
MLAATPLSLRLALRELRGGVKGFRIFLLCLALGVAAIAGVGSLSAALVAGLAADGQKLLGGDIDLRLSHREVTPTQRIWLAGNGTLSTVLEMRAMAHASGKRALIEIKAIDDAYPLYGAMRLAPAGDPQDLVALRDGRWGALLDPAVLRRLGLQIGDSFRVGEATYEIRAAIEHEPDDGTSAFVLGPRVMVAMDSMADTGLVQLGSMLHYHYRVKLPPEVKLDEWRARLTAAFPDAGWRIRDVRNGAPGLRTFLERMRLFLTLVGLTALLVGGLGVGNAVKAYLDARGRTIAILKCVGAPANLVFRIYLIQVLLLACAGIAIGLLVGALAPPAFAGLLQQYLPFNARIGLYPGPLLMAAAYGLLTALAFALWPLARAREVPAAALLRDVAAPSQARPKPVFLAAVAASFLTLAVTAVATAERPDFAAWFVLGAAATLLLFLGAGHAIMDLARRLRRPRRPDLRLALANLHRPGAPTLTIVLSFGLGLSVLVTVATLQGNLSAQVAERLPDQAPAFFFIDIQPGQIDDFERTARAVPGVGEIAKVPMLRGRIVKANGKAIEPDQVAPDARWALRGDRGLTYAATPPDGTDVVAGAWWPADYAGAPLVSLDANIAAGFGVGIGDTLTVNVLGRELTAKIANLRRIDWSSMGINFVLVFAPGLLEAAPHSFLATATAAPDAETPLEVAVTDRFANITAIRVKDALETANRILDNISIAVRSTATVTLAAGVLVLAGAIAAGHRRRVYDAVILKVLGATRADILRTFVLEYAALGLVTAVLAAVIGSISAYVVVTQVMGAGWVWLPGTIAGTALLAMVITVGLGLVGTLAALSQRPAPLLRNE